MSVRAAWPRGDRILSAFLSESWPWTMNPIYVGDSYDLVKRYFGQELAKLGYRW